MCRDALELNAKTLFTMFSVFSWKWASSFFLASILYCLSSQHWYHIFIRILCIFDSTLWRLCLYPLTDHQKTCNPTWRSLMVTGLLWNTILLLPMIWSRNMVRKICQAIHDKQIIFCSGISGIPSLVVVKLDGTVVTKDGRSHVTGKVPAQAVKDWKVFWQRDEGWWGMRGNKEWAKNGVQRVTGVGDHAAHKGINHTQSR